MATALHTPKTLVSRRCSDRVLQAVDMYPIDLQELSLETGSLVIEHDHEFSETKSRLVRDIHVSPGVTSSAKNGVSFIVEINNPTNKKKPPITPGAPY